MPADQNNESQFQYIRLPDGSYGKFRADASDDVIRSAIEKDFPGTFTGKDKWDQYVEPYRRTANDLDRTRTSDQFYGALVGYLIHPLAR
jgi:hypothetical protein